MSPLIRVGSSLLGGPGGLTSDHDCCCVCPFCDQYLAPDPSTCTTTTNVTLCDGCAADDPSLPTYNEYLSSSASVCGCGAYFAKVCDDTGLGPCAPLPNVPPGPPAKIRRAYIDCLWLIAASVCLKAEWTTGTSSRNGCCCIKYRQAQYSRARAFRYSKKFCEWKLVYEWPMVTDYVSAIYDSAARNDDPDAHCQCDDPPIPECTPAGCSISLPEDHTCPCDLEFP